MTPTYRVLFRDVLSGIIHGELPVQKLSYTSTLNAPGSASITIPLNPGVAHVNPQTVEGGGATAIYIERSSRIVWSGLLWDRQADFAAGTLDLQCEGWLSYFRLRHYHATTAFTQTDQADIARALLQHAGQYGEGSRLGMIEPGDEKTGVKRDRTYKESEHKNIGEAVEQLAAVINGFDFSFDAAWRGDDLPTTFRVHYPAVGRARSLMLEQGRNCSITGASIGGKSVVTHAFALGPGDGADQVWASAGSPSKVFPRLEAIESFSDIKEYATLKAKAEERVRTGAAPVVLPAIVLYPDSAPGLDDVDLGDAVTVRGGYGLVAIDGMWRITEISVSVSESSAEQITLTAASRDVFGSDDKSG
ncbi:hypothetical protein ATK36_3184 [Amycolatopsis sulphurea]|uniref:Phage protein D n=1 Tax=Amycolatopsis sulphurea TaxID=76022 RepID=A0A2A9FC83_9PSEU|nr:hypothetical protein [Amycolatopsis sulphurea]PFG48110.1 hypothetical protein ATK36_3184 [Amycolatopsis sulphurea]